MDIFAPRSYYLVVAAAAAAAAVVVVVLVVVVALFPYEATTFEGSKSFHIFLSVAFFIAHDLSRFGAIALLDVFSACYSPHRRGHPKRPDGSMKFCAPRWQLVVQGSPLIALELFYFLIIYCLPP